MLYFCYYFANLSSKKLTVFKTSVLQRNISSLLVCSSSPHNTYHNLKKNKAITTFHLKNFKQYSFTKNAFGNSYVSTMYRSIFTTSAFLDKSKLEDSLIEKQKQKRESEEIVDTQVFPQVKGGDKPASTISPTKVPKAPLWKRFVNEVKHYYNGFRLLFLDVRIASRTLWKILQGKSRTRRELNQFRRAVGDIFRLLPFSVFIIIPFAEFALPFVLRFFPGMLPSTFETSSKQETRLKKELKVKLEMAKFLQDTVEDIAVHANKKNNEAQNNFVEFFKKMRADNQQPTNEEILHYAKLFKDDLTLSNINRPQLVALCRLLQVPTVGTNEFLRLLLEMKLNSLHRDDELIMKEGVDSLSTAELTLACQARGMRALGVPRKRLKQQLTEWIDLHLNNDVPSSLLLLSRALYLPESVPAEEKVKAVISALPEKAAGEAEVRAAELNLERVDNTARYKAAKLEHTEIITEEAEKTKQEKAKEQAAVELEAAEKAMPEVDIKFEAAETISEGPAMTDAARVISDDNKLTQEEIDVIDDAISKIQPEAKDDTTAAAKTELDELREDIKEYQSDVKTLTEEIKDEEHTAELRDTKAGQLIQMRIEKMIGNMEVIIEDLEKTTDQEKLDSNTENQIAVHELVHTMHCLTKLPPEKLKKIFATLDSNKDGHIDVAEAKNVIKLLNQEDVEVTALQLDQIVKLLAEQFDSNKESNDENKTNGNSKVEDKNASVTEKKQKIQ